MISQEIIEEIIYISEKGQTLDKTLILRILSDLLDNTDSTTKDKFGGINFKKSESIDKDTYAIYNRKTNEISILMDKLDSMQSDSILQKNLRIVECISHEVEHLKEEYKISKNNFESLLLACSKNETLYDAISNNIIFKLFGLPEESKISKNTFLKFYNKIYNIIPSERIADIESYKYLINSLSRYPNFEEKYRNDFNLIALGLLKSYMMGYKRLKTLYNCPIVDYFKAIKSTSVLDLLDFYSEDYNTFFNNTYIDFSLEDRFKYGLPINEDDKIKMQKRIIRVN